VEKYEGYGTSKEFHEMEALFMNPIEAVKYNFALRNDTEALKRVAEKNDIKCEKIVELNKLPTIIHWKDTLIKKGKEHFSENQYKYKRVVAVGDIHGDYEKLIKVLRHAKLINRKNDWIATNTILIQIGDLIDDDSHTKEIFDLFIKIKEQATKKGSIVYILIGNHELNNLQLVLSFK